MVMTSTTLRELHRIHQQLGDLRDRQTRGPKQVAARQANVARLEEEVTAARNQARAARVMADQKQLLLKTGEGKIADLRRKLQACGTNREYQALLEQIAADEMANSVLADEILEALEKIDECQKHSVEAEQNLAKGRQELARIQQTVREQQSLVEGEVQRLESELHEAEASLPSDFRDAYDRAVKSRGSDAMAPVDGDSCGGCCQNITPNMHNALGMSRVVFCQTCGRLLYLPEGRDPPPRNNPA